MSDLNNDLCLISYRPRVDGGATFDPLTVEQANVHPQLIRGRLAAAQAFEAKVRTEMSRATQSLKGNPHFLAFVEGRGSGIVTWGSYRLDVVELPKETK